MRDNFSAVFDTVEAYAWSKDYKYELYVQICYKNQISPCCEKAYELLCKAFDAQMDYDMTATETLH